jgi:hypothetical protein
MLRCDSLSTSGISHLTVNKVAALYFVLWYRISALFSVCRHFPLILQSCLLSVLFITFVILCTQPSYYERFTKYSYHSVDQSRLCPALLMLKPPCYHFISLIFSLFLYYLLCFLFFLFLSVLTFVHSIMIYSYLFFPSVFRFLSYFLSSVLPFVYFCLFVPYFYLFSFHFLCFFALSSFLFPHS